MKPTKSLMMQKRLPCFFLLLFCCSVRLADADEFYVSPSGDDAWYGTLPDAAGDGQNGPFATLAMAVSVLQPGDTLYLREGTYRETLTPIFSGEEGAPIVIRNYPGEEALISGADLIAGWTLEDGQIYAAPMNWTLGDRNQVLADGEMLFEARWPNNLGSLLAPTRAVAESGSVSTLTDSNIPGGDDAWTGARLWCAGGSEWICWNAPVTAYDSDTQTLTFDPYTERSFYVPKTGNEYVLMGLRSALDAEGEWWVDPDNGRLLLWAPDSRNPNELMIEARRRDWVADLSGCSNIQLIGLQFRVGGVKTDSASSDLVLKDLTGHYLGHSYQSDVSLSAAVLLNGARIEMSGCEFTLSSGSLVRIAGTDHKIYNNYIHGGNYTGLWNGTMSLSGRRQWVCWNTISDSGRDLVSVHGLMESMVEYNELSRPGWLTRDLGMIYGHTTDFAGTEFRYNLVHDNLAAGVAMGIYFDHASMNAMVHHNVIWNVGMDPVRINNPSYFNLVYNNTSYQCGPTTTFDHDGRDDLFGQRFINNLYSSGFNSKITALPIDFDENLIYSDATDVFSDPVNGDFTLRPGSPAIGVAQSLPGITQEPIGSSSDAGAFSSSKTFWSAGHNFENPPVIGASPQREPVAWANAISNAGFEFGSIEGWTATAGSSTSIISGNGWGLGTPVATMKKELSIGPGAGGVEQQVAVAQGQAHTLSAWVYVSEASETAEVGVRLASGEEIFTSISSTNFTRVEIPFEAGSEDTAATVFLRKLDGAGLACFDNVGLPLPPELKFSIPCTQDFESFPKDYSGFFLNGWTVGSAAAVATEVYSYDSELPLPESVHEQVARLPGGATLGFQIDSLNGQGSKLFFDAMICFPEGGEASETLIRQQIAEAQGKFGCYLNAEGHLVVFHGGADGNTDTLTTMEGRFTPGTWRRVSMLMDLVAVTDVENESIPFFQIYIDGEAQSGADGFAEPAADPAAGTGGTWFRFANFDAQVAEGLHKKINSFLFQSVGVDDLTLSDEIKSLPPRKTYLIRTVLGPDGTMTSDGVWSDDPLESQTIEVKSGDYVTITYAADPFYEIESLLSDGEAVAGAAGAESVVWSRSNLCCGVTNQAGFSAKIWEADGKSPLWWADARGYTNGTALSVYQGYLLNQTNLDASFKLVGLDVQQQQVSVQWISSGPTRGTIRVYSATNLQSDNLWVPVEGAVFHENGTNIWRSAGTVFPNAFYRVELEE